jgi:hypothetical protein
MYTPESLVEVLDRLRSIEHFSTKPAGLRTTSAEIPQRSDFGTFPEYIKAWNEFMLKYDTNFRQISPFNVGCFRHFIERTATEEEVPQIAFKTFREILWEIRAADVRVSGVRHLPKPPSGTNISITEEINWET